tara:strand:+ start:369 stop:1181 length:813 start_codon:yes stop_codon:yes gene_type:complete
MINRLPRIILSFGAVVSILPLIWMVITSLSANENTLSFFDLLGKDFTINNYQSIMNKIPLLRYMYNSIVITSLTIAGTVFSSSFVAYAFSILRWKSRDKVFMLIIFTMMLPLQVTMIPVFIINNQLGWLNTFYPLVVPAYLGGGAFNIFLFRQFFLNISKEIIDAAKMDGLNHFQIYYKIVLPIAKPVVIAVCILTFLFTWNDFMGPLIYLTDQAKGTLALGLMLFVGQYQTEWGQLMALSIVIIFPVFLIFIAFQKHFLNGLMFGGSKR